MGEKLTKAQRDHLFTLALYPRYHLEKLPAVRALALKGLVSTNVFGCTRITDLGRQALAQAEDER